MADVQTKDTSSILDNIKHFYGDAVGNSLIQIEINEMDELGFSLVGYVSSLEYSGDKTKTILFINRNHHIPIIAHFKLGRLVNMHKELKKEIDKVYSTLKFQKVHFFAFLHLTFLTKNIDVNIHPQKSEVRFLNEDKVIKRIAKAIASKLEQVPESPKKVKQVISNFAIQKFDNSRRFRRLK